jgi:hypothetical protein
MAHHLASSGNPGPNLELLFLDVSLAAGRHELRLWFVNDLNAAGEDRNLTLDQVRFYLP